MARTLYGGSQKGLHEAVLRTKNFNIAILSKDSFQYHRFVEGYCNEIKKRTVCSPTITLVPEVLSWNDACDASRDIIASRPDAIVTVGALCSQAMRYMLNEESIETPFFFGAVDQPDFLGLVPSVIRPYRSTGISSGKAMYIANAYMFDFIKPAARHVLIPFSISADGGNLTNAAALMKRHFEKNNVKSTVIPFYAYEDPMRRIAPFLSDVDAVFCFEGCGIINYKEALVLECNSRKTTIFAGNLEMVQAGAAAGFVVDHQLTGKALAGYTFKALWLDVPMTSIPLSFLGSNARRLAINTTTAAEQGIVLDEIVMGMLKDGIVYGKISLGDAGMLEGQEIPEKGDADV